VRNIVVICCSIPKRKALSFMLETEVKMKRAYCLYRVSTKNQVDVQKDDIPMQKIACHEFAKVHGWIIEKEFSEKGVSGFKVSADERDAIQNLKTAALNKEFDILRYFMDHRGEVVQNKDLYENVWGEQYLTSAGNTIMVHILNLRKKLERDVSKPEIIKTVWGKGYRID